MRMIAFNIAILARLLLTSRSGCAGSGPVVRIAYRAVLSTLFRGQANFNAIRKVVGPENNFPLCGDSSCETVPVIRKPDHYEAARKCVVKASSLDTCRFTHNHISIWSV